MILNPMKKLQILKQLVWAETKEGIQPITVYINIKGRKVKALINSEVNKNYIHWKMAGKLKIKLVRKQEPYKLYRIGGEKTPYNKRIVVQETTPMYTQINSRN